MGNAGLLTFSSQLILQRTANQLWGSSYYHCPVVNHIYRVYCYARLKKVIVGETFSSYNTRQSLLKDQTYYYYSRDEDMDCATLFCEHGFNCFDVRRHVFQDGENVRTAMQSYTWKCEIYSLQFTIDYSVCLTVTRRNLEMCFTTCRCFDLIVLYCHSAQRHCMLFVLTVTERNLESFDSRIEKTYHS